jgi:hypothetical protein
MRSLLARDGSEYIHLHAYDTALYEYNGGHDNERHVLNDDAVRDVKA